MTEYSYKKDWMTDDQYECLELLADLFHGHHHINGPVKPFGRGIEHNTSTHRFATFDFDALTRAVFLVHDRMIRLDINPSGPGMIKLCLFKRHKREGRMSEGHPTIETALALHRRRYANIEDTVEDRQVQDE